MFKHLFTRTGISRRSPTPYLRPGCRTVRLLLPWLPGWYHGKKEYSQQV